MNLPNHPQNEKSHKYVHFSSEIRGRPKFKAINLSQTVGKGLKNIITVKKVGSLNSST